MKLTDQTKKILHNFVKINNEIVFFQSSLDDTNSVIRTIADEKIYSEAIVPELFEKEVVLYQLDKFLSVVNAMEDPEITLFDNHLVVSKDKASVKIRYSKKDNLKTKHKTSSPNINNFHTSFTISQEQFGKVLDVSKILGLEQIRVYSKDDKLILQAVNLNKESNPDSPSSETFEIEVGTPSPNVIYNYVFDRKSFTFLPGDYKISLFSLGAKFENTTEYPSLLYVLTRKI